MTTHSTSIQHVLVTGATGYVGGRLAPRLLQDGIRVRWTFTDPDREKPWWATDEKYADLVDSVQMDVSDAGQVDAALEGIDAVYYLIHGMGGDDFMETDRKAAQNLANAVDKHQVSRIVYLSGIVPPVDEAELSDHITSRLEVERILTASSATTITLRAAVLMGSGSTSFEIIRQVSERMPVQTVPTWMNSDVQPIAIVDVIEALVAALDPTLQSRSYDVGGPDVMPYADLLDEYANVAGLARPQVMVPLLPTALVGTLVGALTEVPSSTVEALVESLHHDMVCADDDFAKDLLPQGYSLLSFKESARRALAEVGEESSPRDRDPMAEMPQDPHWASGGEDKSLLSKAADAVKSALD